MITNVTHDIGAALERESEIHRHIGLLTVRAAATDEQLTVLLARALAPTEYPPIIAVMKGVFFNTKMGYLKDALPDAWADKERLLCWLKRVEDHRNELAHSTVRTGFSLTTPEATTRISHVKSGAVTEMNTAEFTQWEARSSVLFLVMVVLSRHPEIDLSRLDLTEIAREVTANGEPAYVAAAAEMFPALNSSAGQGTR